MRTFFAVVPDGRGVPSALFAEIEDAIAWALERHGGDQFRIRACCTIDAEVSSRVKGGRSPMTAGTSGHRGGNDS